MRDRDLLISNAGGTYLVKVSGRANFEYAVPLRSIAKASTDFKGIMIDLGDCTAMDSTFMGVLTMLALKFRKRGLQVVLVGAGENLLKLLRDLGVAKLFKCVERREVVSGNKVETSGVADMLATAETVAEAHKALVGADAGNAEKFKQVIEFADKDVERLKKTH